jgi:hypothetical protein
VVRFKSALKKVRPLKLGAIIRRNFLLSTGSKYYFFAVLVWLLLFEIGVAVPVWVLPAFCGQLSH